MLRLVTVCRPAKVFSFLLWASRRLFCHNNNNNNDDDDDDEDDNDDDDDDDDAGIEIMAGQRTMSSQKLVLCY